MKIKMENKEWNPNEWQGKRQDQVEYSNGIGGVFLILLFTTLVVFCLFSQS
jgi:hypothetical protein